MQEHRTRLAQVTALWVASGLILPNTHVVNINEHQVKDSEALEFMLDSVVKTEKGSSAVLTLLDWTACWTSCSSPTKVPWRTLRMPSSPRDSQTL